MEFTSIRELFDIKENSFGFPELELTKAEERLGITLPETLRKYYLELGNHQKLNQTHNKLLNPDELLMDVMDVMDEQECLIFYVENQASAFWGIKHIDLSQSNPKVYRKYSHSKWELDSENLTVFLKSMAFMQAIFSFDFHANICGIESKYERIIKTDFQEVEGEFSIWNVNFYRDQKSGILAVFKSEIQTDVFVIAKTQEDFESLTEKFDFEWDYNSEEDK